MVLCILLSCSVAGHLETLDVSRDQSEHENKSSHCIILCSIKSQESSFYFLIHLTTNHLFG